jgi:asparagine synthase (glutamine-hydrolysing)
MCGIAGTLNMGLSPPPVDRAELKRISAHMKTRGPDGDGLWIDPAERCGLVHRRLAIIDTSDAGLQPMVDPATGMVIVFNGEIYNFRELRSELGMAGVVFHTGTDTEVLLKLFARMGNAAWPRLRGMFAAAIWNPATQCLTLARDGFGIKPLYVAEEGGSIRFASQVKSLRAGGVAGQTLEPAGEVGFFLWGHVPEPFTLWRGIRALTPGTAVDFGADGSRRVTEFFSLSREIAAPPPLPIQPKSPADALELLRHALQDSVLHHLIADVPVGVFLSAGIDSSVLTALASFEFPHQLQSLCLGFPEFQGLSADETVLAREVARVYCTEHVEASISAEAFLAERDRLLAAMDQPSIDGINVFLVSAAAHAQGWKVALSGLGADELFAGYTSFTQVPRVVRLVGALPGRRTLGKVSGELLRTVTGDRFSPKLSGLLELGGSWGGAYLLKRGLFLPRELEGKFSPETLNSALGELATESRLGRTIEGISEDRSRISALELSWYMRNQLLRDADWASMANSLELRVPFVDMELLRTVAGLAAAGFPMSKQSLGHAPQPPLGANILNRPKTGFQVPLWKWAGLSQPHSAGNISRLWAERIFDHAIGEKPGLVGKSRRTKVLAAA